MNHRIGWPSPRWKTRDILLVTVACATLLCLIAGPVKHLAINRAIKSGMFGWARVSPFTSVQCESDDRVLVKYDGASYQLIAIEDLPTETILSTCRDQFADRWEKRFVEDLVEVLVLMGRPPGDHVRLLLRDSTGVLKAVPHASLTAENRRQAYDVRHARL